MALKRMKETPTGWGTGYTNIDHVICEKVSSIKLKCVLVPYKGNNEEFIGTDVMFENVRVSVSPKALIGYELGKGNLLACYVDSGVIHCIPEKELKK